MNKLNNELIDVHQYLKQRLDTLLQGDDVVEDDDMKKLSHAVLITGKIAYEYTIKKKQSPKSSKRVFFKHNPLQEG